MASQVEIANMALAHLGTRSTIAALDEDSTEAKKISLFYNTALESALASFDWSFARKHEALAETGSPQPGWVYQYAYPNNCVKVRNVVGIDRVSTDTPFEVAHSEVSDSKVILTDQPAAEVIYTALVTNTALYPAKFVEAFAARLAAFIAVPLTGKRAIRDDALALFNLLGTSAMAQDANESQRDEHPDASWISART